MAVQSVGDLHPSGAVVSPMAAAVFAQMLERPLQRRISLSSGIHPENAAELREVYAELDRVGRMWMASRPRKSAGCVTEMNAGSVADMEINTEKAGELLRLTDSRIRQLLRDETLPGRKVGRRWVVKKSDVLAYRVPRKAAA
jgi:excisionase family DNA binding protein